MKNIINIFNKKIIKYNYTKKTIIFYLKSYKICINFIDKKIFIHKGNVFKKLYINKYMIGFNFGFFIFTRKPFFFPKLFKKKKSLRR